MRGNPRVPTTITGRSTRLGSTDAQCSGWSGLGGANGLTPVKIFSEAYYTNKGCFDANVTTMCTANIDEYGINLPTGETLAESTSAQLEVCASSTLVSAPSVGFKAVADRYPQTGWAFLGMQETGMFRNWPLIYQVRGIVMEWQTRG